MPPAFLEWLATGAFALGVGALTWLVAGMPPDDRTTGYRGRARQRARARSVLFRAGEPWLRLAARQLSRFALHELRARIDHQLSRAGEPMGLAPDEVIVIALAQCIGLAVTLAAIASGLGRSGAAWGAVGASFGLCAPLLQLRELAAARTSRIERGLPEAIDLLALCMSGGLDFTTALRTLLAEGSLRYRDLQEELERVTDALTTGASRSEALSAFAGRVRAPAVGDFVNAVVQAERTGTPLREVLDIQARMLRMQRSVRAEEAAARAAIWLLLPLCLLLGMILVLLFGPFVVNGFGI